VAGALLRSVSPGAVAPERSQACKLPNRRLCIESSCIGISGAELLERTLSWVGVWLRGLAGRGCGGMGQQVGDHLGEPAIHRGVGEKPTRGELARNPRYG
jgi:hypothetical protein